MPMPSPLGSRDIVSVRGKHLYKADGTRFFMKGIAFPIPPSDYDVDNGGYNSTSWIRILHQLRDLELEYNTVRLYVMDPKVDYSAFFNEAASLGVYVMVPLTASAGDGVLDRSIPAPHCFPRKLYEYGVSCLQNYMQYPNVLAGVLANEVINSLEAWEAAPCLKAYARDLKAYMRSHFNRSIPFIYAAQDSSINAAVDHSESMRLTADYLACDKESADDSGDGTENDDNALADATVDIFGINVESWCSSDDTFRWNNFGNEGSYYALWKLMHNATGPLLFTEMGCSHLHFNHDSDPMGKGMRHWKQIPVVLTDMADTWSGFCAYAYFGNSLFNMFGPKRWDGEGTLEPTEDFYNFRDQLAQASQIRDVNHEEPRLDILPPPSCDIVTSKLKDCCEIEFFDVAKMRSYVGHKREIYGVEGGASVTSRTLSAVGTFSLLLYAFYRFVLRAKQSSESPDESAIQNVECNYGSIC